MDDPREFRFSGGGESHESRIEKYGSRFVARRFAAPEARGGDDPDSESHDRAEYLLDGGYAARGLRYTVVFEAEHTPAFGGPPDVVRRGPGDDEAFYLLADLHHFENPDPPPVPRPATPLTPDRLGKGHFGARIEGAEREAEVSEGDFVHRGRAFACFAQFPGEPLRDDAIHRGGRKERLHAHVGEAREGGRGVVRVERRENNVSRILTLSGCDSISIASGERSSRR